MPYTTAPGIRVVRCAVPAMLAIREMQPVVHVHQPRHAVGDVLSQALFVTAIHHAGQRDLAVLH